MNILYVRTSSFFQNSERQKINKKDYDLVIEDVISGSVPFFERPGGKQVLKYLNDGIIKCLYVHQIDRLGRNLRDVLNTAHTFTVKASPICFIAQGLRIIDEDGKENPISKLIISILGTIGEMERNQIRERQLEGISIAKAQGRFLGRKIW
jgi:DNA invertase Pin-like site-specific DNA recombinase